MLRQDAARFMLGKYLSDQKNPVDAKETIGDGVGRKYAKSQFSDQNRRNAITGCWLCRIVREARDESIDCLADETHGHINSADCEGMAMTVTAAHHSIWGHLYDSMHASSLSRLTKKVT